MIRLSEKKKINKNGKVIENGRKNVKIIKNQVEQIGWSKGRKNEENNSQKMA